MQTPCAHLEVQSSSWQNPFLAATDAFGGTRSLRALRFEQIEGTDDMKRYARATYISARSCLVNSALDLFVEIRFGVKCECVLVQRDMLWSENECSYVLCEILWYEKRMFACTIWYALVCKINVRMRCAICYGVQDECLHVSYDMFGVQNECLHAANCVCCAVTNCWKPLSWCWNKLEWPKT